MPSDGNTPAPKGMSPPMRPRRLSPRRATTATLGLALPSGLAACSGPKDTAANSAADGGKPARGGTLTMLNTEAQSDFDPARLYTSGSGNVPSLVFRTLTTRNRAAGAAGTKAVPDLHRSRHPERERHGVDVATGAAWPVDFVALPAPQIARRLTRTTQVPLLCSALTGTLVVLTADLPARRLFSPAELPVGVLTAPVGARRT